MVIQGLMVYVVTLTEGDASDLLDSAADGIEALYGDMWTP